MQKDIQQSKGETQQKKSELEKEKPKEGDKLKQVGHDINANLKEKVGVGVGNYSSGVDREKSLQHEKKFNEKKDKERKEEKKERERKERENEEKIKERREGVSMPKDSDKKETGMVGHKIQEIAYDVNANLKQNVGIGLGNFSSEVDRERATEHQKKFEEKRDENKQKFEEKKDELKEKKNEMESKVDTGIYGHKIQEIGHTVNANLKETIGIGIGDYPSEVDREKVKEHQEMYEERVKEQQNTEIEDSSSITHKIKEVAHNVNANMKEMVGIGLGNYSSEVDRELANLHKQKYEEKTIDPKERELSKEEHKKEKEKLSKEERLKEKEHKKELSKEERKKEKEKLSKEERLKEKERKKEKERLKEKEKQPKKELSKEEGIQKKDDKQKVSSGDNKL